MPRSPDTATACSARSSKPTTRSRRRWCARGARSTASRDAPRCARGCTGSRRTSASTCSATGSGARGRWTSDRRAPSRRSTANNFRRTPGSTPIPDGRAIALDADPAEVAVERETLRLAFVNALQLLPPRQRAVLVLREVLRWRAAEVAELLDTTEASVNSALQRARATLGSADVDTARGDLMDDSQQQLLARYVDAFERFDVPALVSLLREDAVQSMPPYTHWLVGPDAIAGWMRGPGIGCEGSRLLPTMANGAPAFGQYRADGQGGHAPWALVVLEITGDRITGRAQLPRHEPLRRVRAAGEAVAVTPSAGSPVSVARRPTRPSSSSSDGLTSHSCTVHPSRRAARCRRASSSTRARSGRVERHSDQRATSAPSTTSTTTARRVLLLRRHTHGQTAGGARNHRYTRAHPQAQIRARIRARMRAQIPRFGRRFAGCAGLSVAVVVLVVLAGSWSVLVVLAVLVALVSRPPGPPSSRDWVRRAAARPASWGRRAATARPASRTPGPARTSRAAARATADSSPYPPTGRLPRPRGQGPWRS